MRLCSEVCSVPYETTLNKESVHSKTHTVFYKDTNSFITFIVKKIWGGV